MSRHSLTPLPAYADHDIVVGWDGPLSTFYAQVMRPSPDDGDLVDHLLWVGWQHNEITDPQIAVDHLSAYAVVPAGLVAQLTADREAQGYPQRSSAVQHMVNALTTPATDPALVAADAQEGAR